MTDFAAKYGRWALIAGASEGIGACLADELGARGRSFGHTVWTWSASRSA
ncbi:hypothetical protein [Mycolicibacterium sp. YH-1]|nr:hypothetical protein [Mycolicibacterium sp. YH-1]UNB54747.1 hypothetical protein L0M16_10740 [Mycolicibacterium sp. YH-1]